MTRPYARLSEVAREILGYLERNPQAGDTLDGVAQWWVVQQRIHAAVQEVRCALEQLVQLGLVSRRKTTPHGPVLYAVRKRATRAKAEKENQPINDEGNDERKASE